MIKWENNVLGFVTPTDWLDIPFQITRPNDPADLLFGDQKTANLVAEWESIADEYQIPVMAQFHAFDTESQKTLRMPIDNHNIEKGLIKVKLDQSERLRALFRNGVQGDSAIYDYVINDGMRLAEQVITRTKVAKNEVLATGKVTIKENNLDLTVDYGVTHNNLDLDFGAGATKSIPEQIQDIVDAATAIGVTLNGIYTSKAMLNKLRQNKDVQRAINGVNMEGVLISKAALESYLSTEFGIEQVIVNDLQYGADLKMGTNGRPVATLARYYPADKMTFFATGLAGNLGTGLWGDAPELDVAQLLATSNSPESPFVCITQWAEKDPSVLWTKASTLFMPVLYNPNSLFIATAKSTDATETYTPVENPTGNPSAQGWYERSGESEPYTYTLTEDTEVESGKTYYVKGA